MLIFKEKDCFPSTISLNDDPQFLYFRYAFFVPAGTHNTALDDMFTNASLDMSNGSSIFETTTDKFVHPAYLQLAVFQCV